MRGSGGKWKMLESVLKQSIEDEKDLSFPSFF